MAHCWWTMSICNEHYRRYALSSALFGLACFDVQQVELPSRPERLEIDDFEDGDDAPKASAFAPWSCSAWPAPSSVSCGSDDSGTAAGRVETVRFELRDTRDGRMDYPTAQFQSSARLGSMDLGSYGAISFRAQLELSPEDAPHAPPLRVAVRCDGAGTSGAGREGSWLEAPVAVGPEWAVYAVPIDTLLRPNYVVSFSRRDCLAGAEGLEFMIAPEYPDGQDLVATLRIDDVALE
jgi:hypothetical protein